MSELDPHYFDSVPSSNPPCVGKFWIVHERTWWLCCHYHQGLALVHFLEDRSCKNYYLGVFEDNKSHSFYWII
jgi:hypothetical protein